MRVFPILAVSTLLFAAVSQYGQSQQTTITLEAKSYIARMVTEQSEQQGKPDSATTKALGFENLVGGRVQAYELMLGTDHMFREDPQTGSKDTDQFRLWSKIRVTGTCAAGKIAQWAVENPEMAFGKEGQLNATGEMLTPLKVVPAASGNTPQKEITFQYAVKGRPHALTTPIFENIQPRQCYWIWHSVSGTASCSEGKFTVSANIRGSKFPSHRLWQDGKTVSELKQGPFESLWSCGSEGGIVK
jgi:hypothetical protein